MRRESTMYADDTDQAARQVFTVLRIGFTAAPILFGIDKFFNWTVHWPDYLAPWVNDIVPGSGQQLMYAVRIAEPRPRRGRRQSPRLRPRT